MYSLFQGKKQTGDCSEERMCMCQSGDLTVLPRRPGGSCCPPALRALAGCTVPCQEHLVSENLSWSLGSGVLCFPGLVHTFLDKAEHRGQLSQTRCKSPINSTLHRTSPDVVKSHVPHLGWGSVPGWDLSRMACASSKSTQIHFHRI